MSQYLLVSLKGNDSTSKINRLVGNLGKVTEFKVNNDLTPFESQDQLVKIADDLTHLDQQTFSMLTRFSRSVQDLYKKIDQDNIRNWTDFAPEIKYDPVTKYNIEVITDNGDQQLTYSLPDYMKNFQWDERSISNKNNVEAVKNSLQDNVVREEENVRALTNDYSDAGNALNNIIRGNEGTLATKNLDEVASKVFQNTLITCKSEIASLQSKYAGSNSANVKFCVQTENLRTVFVVIKKSEKKNFENEYHLQSNYVVPDLPQLIEEDNDFYLYAVTLLKTQIEDYKNGCKERKWNVREFNFDKNLLKKNQERNKGLITRYRESQVRYSDYLHTTFSQLFIYWMHIKALRVFVESRLLYGINEIFQAYMIETSTKNIPKIHKSLQSEYNDGMEDDKNDDDDANGDDADLVYSYFSNRINIIGLTPAK